MGQNHHRELHSDEPINSLLPPKKTKKHQNTMFFRILFKDMMFFSSQCKKQQRFFHKLLYSHFEFMIESELDLEIFCFCSELR